MPDASPPVFSSMSSLLSEAIEILDVRVQQVENDLAVRTNTGLIPTNTVLSWTDVISGIIGAGFVDNVCVERAFTHLGTAPHQKYWQPSIRQSASPATRLEAPSR